MEKKYLNQSKQHLTFRWIGVDRFRQDQKEFAVTKIVQMTTSTLHLREGSASTVKLAVVNHRRVFPAAVDLLNTGTGIFDLYLCKLDALVLVFVRKCCGICFNG